MPDFAALGVPAPILKALEDMEYESPTEVQAAALPVLLKGRDALVEAQTGSGKTTAFGIPAVTVGARGPGLRVVVLVPTRELARQVAEEIRALGAGSPFRAVAVTGGVQAEQEERTLGGDVRCVVATPGRLLALLEPRKVRLDHVELVVLDEADRMLDMGFHADVEKVLAATAQRKQTVMVSATLPRDVRELAARHMREPREVRVEGARVPETLTHFRLNVLEGRKEAALVALLKKENPERCIVFLAQRNRVVKFTKLLKRAGLAADPLQGEMTHDQRRHVFDLFKRGITRILVATDLAGRGLDVPEMELVVNVDVPEGRGDYVHRAGRAARLGRAGKVVTMVLPDEKDRRLALEREAGAEFIPYRLEFSDADLPPDPEAVKKAEKKEALKKAAIQRMKRETPKKAAAKAPRPAKDAVPPKAEKKPDKPRRATPDRPRRYAPPAEGGARPARPVKDEPDVVPSRKNRPRRDDA